MNNNLAQISNKLHEVSLSDGINLPRISQYGKLYHNSESLTKCPRCQILSELIESGLVRSLYRCVNCGIFSKITKKQSPPDGKPIECRLKNPCQGCQGKSGIITAVDRKLGKQGGHGDA